LGGTGGDCEWLMSGKIPFSYLTDSKNELKMLKGPDKCFICFKGIFFVCRAENQTREKDREIWIKICRAEN